MDEKFRCDACDIEFESRDEFEMHLREHHGHGHEHHS